jgi:hypothetical protein
MDGYVMNIGRLFLLLTTLVSFSGSSAEKLIVYRWVDKNNVVHFSQHQPLHDNYIEISVDNNKKASLLVDKKQPKDQVIALEKKAANSPKNDISDDKCKTAQLNMLTLQDFDRIQYKDEKGNVKVLSNLEKEQQLAMNTKQVEVYCTDK